MNIFYRETAESMEAYYRLKTKLDGNNNNMLSESESEYFIDRRGKKCFCSRCSMQSRNRNTTWMETRDKDKYEYEYKVDNEIK